MRIHILGNRVADWRKRRKLTKIDLASLTGISRFQLARIEEGETEEPYFGSAFAIAQALRVHISAIASFDSAEGYPAQGVAGYHFSAMGQVEAFHDLMESAEIVTTISKRVDSYLQSDEMIELMNPEAFSSAESKQNFLAYVTDQRLTLANKPFAHVHVCPMDLLRVMERHSTWWLVEFEREIGAIDRPTVYAFVLDYVSLSRRISAILPPLLRGWQKIAVIDDVVAKFHFDGPLHHIEWYDRKVIRRVLDAAYEHVEQNVVHDFPGFRPVRSSTRCRHYDNVRTVVSEVRQTPNQALHLTGAPIMLYPEYQFTEGGPGR